MHTIRKIIGAIVLTTGIFVHQVANAQQDIPAQIRTVAESKAGNHKITKWITDKQRGKYIATVLNNETFKTIEIDMKGKWLKTSEALLPNKVPDNITRAVASYVKEGYEADNYTLIEEGNSHKYYTVDLSSDDEDLTLHLNTEGKLIKKLNR